MIKHEWQDCSEQEIETFEDYFEEGATEILESIPVAKLLTILAAQEKGVIVVDMNGKKLGMANAHSFVAALATSDVKENKPKI